ncbi:hypothetical protein BDQ17DRAFT_1249599 [Cyathus striatus]|nr:hypothetical protein BDQ17DRAFT_1249599 [Cyathus striatus]
MASDNEPVQQPLQKKRKKHPATVKKTAQRLVEMPFDVLFEIFQLLHPLDLLHLSRTMKALRGIILDRTSASVWKQARHNMNGLPECPEDISEPCYASLLFENRCLNQDQCASRKTQIWWEFRARWCQKCVRDDNRSV